MSLDDNDIKISYLVSISLLIKLKLISAEPLLDFKISGSY